MTRIIKADEMPDRAGGRADALNLADFSDQARCIILDARKDAARIMADARAKGDAAEQEARQKGYAEGLARGQNDGYADGERRARTEVGKQFAEDYAGLLELAREAIASLTAAGAESHRKECSQVLELAILLARKIVGAVTVADIRAAEVNLAKAMDLAHVQGQALVKVNPGQLARLREHFGELTAMLGDSAEVSIEPDEAITPGGVKVISRHGEIDATVETQLANAARVLLGREMPVVKADREQADSCVGRYEPVSNDDARTAESTRRIPV